MGQRGIYGEGIPRRGRVRTGTRKNNIQDLWPIHKEIVRQAIIGTKRQDIARNLGISPVTVTNTLNSPVGIAQTTTLELARDACAVDISKELVDLAPTAVKVISEILKDEDGMMKTEHKLKAATDLLDRVGFSAPKVSRIESVSVHVTAEDIEEAKRRARSVGLVVPTKVENVEVGK